MNQRQLLLTATALALAVQAGVVAVYHRATGGCFCAILSNRPSPGPFSLRVFELGSSPLRHFPGLLSWAPQVEGWAAVSIFGAINSLFWAAGFFVLLNLIAFTLRIRLDPRSRTFPFVRIVGSASARPAFVAGGVALMVLAGAVSGFIYRMKWIDSAEEAVRVAVNSVRHGQPFRRAEGFEIQCYDDCGAAVFAGPYQFVRNEASLGTHPLDRYVSPTRMTGRLRTATGARFYVAVYHIDGVWSVLLGEDQEGSEAAGEPVVDGLHPREQGK